MRDAHFHVLMEGLLWLVGKGNHFPEMGIGGEIGEDLDRPGF